MYGLDLFSGIGGITKALEGYVQPVAYCENDRYAQAVLLNRMADGSIPIAPIADDVRTLAGDDLPLPIDIVYGGPPCQPWSSAGRRRGKSDERNMWPEALRLVKEIRPAHCFFENVDELATDDYLIEIVEHLEALGYVVPWPLILAASDVGAPHERQRIWIVSHLAGEPMGIAGQPRIDGCLGQTPHTPGKRFPVQGIDNAKILHQQKRKASENISRRNRGVGALIGMDSVADVTSVRWSERRPKPAGIERGHGAAASNLQIADLDTAGLPLFQGIAATSEAHGRSQSDWDRWWAIEPSVGRVVHGLSFRVDRIKCLGNAVVPCQAREAFERLMGIK